jgi:hypothetical protein
MRTGRISNTYYLIGILALCSAVSLGSYLLASNWIFRIGYPLDDAWIHQTYARNLASTGSWAFLPGQPSAGSTAPGWSLLLALGYWLNLSSYLWTFLWGWALLTVLAVVAAFGFRILVPDRQDAGIWAGILVIFEWHMTWAAGSGMETLLSALIALMVLLWAIRLEERFGEGTRSNRWQWFGLGILIGLSIWVRPDGITLLAVIGLTLLLVKGKLKSKLLSLLILGTGFLLMTVPYLIFNQVLAGEIWPNTFYAKQAEYAVLRNLPYWQRFLNVSRQPRVYLVWDSVISYTEMGQTWGSVVGFCVLSDLRLAFTSYLSTWKIHYAGDTCILSFWICGNVQYIKHPNSK